MIMFMFMKTLQFMQQLCESKGVALQGISFSFNGRPCNTDSRKLLCFSYS